MKHPRALGGLPVFMIDFPALLIHRIEADIDAVIGIPPSGYAETSMG
jgi:hypothetical protein